MPADTLIIVAAYNEADRIGETARRRSPRPFRARPCGSPTTARPTAPPIARVAGARVVRSERVIGKGGRRDGRRPRGRSDARARLRRKRRRCSCSATATSAASRTEAPAARRGRPAGDSDLAVAAFARRVGGGLGLAVGFARWAIRRRCGSRGTAPISGQRALQRRRARRRAAVRAGLRHGGRHDDRRGSRRHRVSEIELELEHRATGRTPAGFLHRGRQLVDFVRVYAARR